MSRMIDRPWDYDVLVIGAGAAGLVAAFTAAERGLHTMLLEKNRRPGVKILMSGGTRCNLTQHTDRRGIIRAYGSQGAFLHSALALLGPADVVAMIEAEGVPTKVEPGGKIFPTSDRATDVLAALMKRFERSGAVLAVEEPALNIDRHGDGFAVVTPKRTVTAQRLIVTTGGQSYPGCGTCGDGYAWARALGHTIVPLRPALVPITTSADWIRQLKGVTLPDVNIRVIEPPIASVTKPNCLAQRRGSFLLTHFGLSGPAVLDVSREVSCHPRANTLILECDFLPDLKEPAVDERLRRTAGELGKRHIAGLLPEEIPRRLAEALLQQAAIPPEQRAAELSKSQRQQLVQQLKHLAIPIAGTQGYGKAEVTAGGVCLDEVDSHTMQSKRTPNLYFAGELLDLDGPIGGYNFQAAFATGMLAGSRV